MIKIFSLKFVSIFLFFLILVSLSKEDPIENKAFLSLKEKFKDPKIFDCNEDLEAICIKKCYEKDEDFDRCLQDENDKLVQCSCSKRSFPLKNLCTKKQILECKTKCNSKLQSFYSCKRDETNIDNIHCFCSEFYSTKFGNEKEKDF